MQGSGFLEKKGCFEDLPLCGGFVAFDGLQHYAVRNSMKPV